MKLFLLFTGLFANVSAWGWLGDFWDDIWNDAEWQTTSTVVYYDYDNTDYYNGADGIIADMADTLVDAAQNMSEVFRIG